MAALRVVKPSIAVVTSRVWSPSVVGCMVKTPGAVCSAGGQPGGTVISYVAPGMITTVLRALFTSLLPLTADKESLTLSSAVAVTSMVNGLPASTWRRSVSGGIATMSSLSPPPNKFTSVYSRGIGICQLSKFMDICISFRKDVTCAWTAPPTSYTDEKRCVPGSDMMAASALSLLPSVMFACTNPLSRLSPADITLTGTPAASTVWVVIGNGSPACTTCGTSISIDTGVPAGWIVCKEGAEAGGQPSKVMTASGEVCPPSAITP